MKSLHLRILILFIALLLSSCLPAAAIDPQLAESQTLPTQPKAPPINNQTWLNTDRPLTQADLNGKVILIDFWTFG
jgi:hypothetical protein